MIISAREYAYLVKLNSPGLDDVTLYAFVKKKVQMM